VTREIGYFLAPYRAFATLKLAAAGGRVSSDRRGLLNRSFFVRCLPMKIKEAIVSCTIFFLAAAFSCHYHYCAVACQETDCASAQLVPLERISGERSIRAEVALIRVGAPKDEIDGILGCPDGMVGMGTVMESIIIASYCNGRIVVNFGPGNKVTSWLIHSRRKSFGDIRE
jgi:hypothetical protein